MRNLLIIEDEPLLLEEMVMYLAEQGFLCETAASYVEGRKKILDQEYDTVVLDITLPDGSGLKLLEILKANFKDTMILIVSARDSLADKLTGLNLGADDYITKPFHLEELNARINALLRRRSSGSHNTTIVIDHIEVDTSSQIVSFKNEVINLTRKEYELLLYFIVNKNRVVSKQSIAQHLWGPHYASADNYDTVYVHAMNLRKKISLHTGKDYIKTVYGMGYKFVQP